LRCNAATLHFKRFALLCLAQSLFLRGQALAGETGGGLPVSSAAFSPLETWLTNLAWLLGAVLLAVKLFKEFRPSPPNYRQFAALEHRHSSLVHVSQYSDQIKECTRQRLDIRQEIGNQTAKLERQLDHVRNAMSTQHDQVMARLDDFNQHHDARLGHVYETIKPLAPAIAANTRSIETHLADHRAGKA